MFDSSKASFLQHNLLDFIIALPEDRSPAWGVMNAHQAIEHLALIFDISSTRRQYDLVTPEEYLPKFIAFLRSDKVFNENTKAPENLIGEEPLPLETLDIVVAKEKLRESVKNFFDYFKDNPNAVTVHPTFGPLGFADWILLHYKHATHHMRQFGAELS